MEVGRTEGLEGLVKGGGWKDRGPGGFGEGWRFGRTEGLEGLVKGGGWKDRRRITDNMWRPISSI